MTDRVILLENVRVRAPHPGGKREILAVDSLEVRRGERVAVIGQSGAGKTTLLRLIKGAVRPEPGGVVEVLGRRLPVEGRAELRRFQRTIGMIHQAFDLIGRESAWANVIHGRLGHNPLWRSLLGVYSDRDVQLCLDACREVHLEDKLDRDARTLSGGEQQRVAIARALAQEPEIFLADEPVSSLDPGLARSILETLVEVAELHHLTLLMNLHLPELACQYGQRVVALRHGRVACDLPAAEVTPERLVEVYTRTNGNGHAPLPPLPPAGAPAAAGLARADAGLDLPGPRR